jgi:hypothetical protein
MVTSVNEDIYMWVEIYLYSLSWKRRFLARFFEKYKITEKEYLDWVYKHPLK